MSDDWRTLPHFYCVQPVTTNVTVLLSVNVPYGLITEWPSDRAGNVAAIKSDFSAIYTTPSLAWRISDKASISAGFNIVYADAELTANRGPLGVRTGKGNDIGYGYTASIHGQLAEKWTAGARFQWVVKVKLDGDVGFDAYSFSSGSAGIDLPSSLNMGVVNRSVERLHLGLDLVWTQWSTYDELVYIFGAGYPLTNPEVNSKRWEDVWSIRFGGEYELTRRWVLRSGYAWDQSPMPDSTRAPELPGADRQMLMAGLGWRNDRCGIDIAYSHLWSGKAQSGSEVVAVVPSTAGSYETGTHIIGLSPYCRF